MAINDLSETVSTLKSLVYCLTLSHQANCSYLYTRRVHSVLVVGTSKSIIERHPVIRKYQS